MYLQHKQRQKKISVIVTSFAGRIIVQNFNIEIVQIESNSIRNVAKFQSSFKEKFYGVWLQSLLLPNHKFEHM